ncbi:DUF674 family protein [Quillaja saponaria]|uniref:DUF674 family protein n=1 Tax=Quillaja saponaria TaxID=32244 RepID=A0AAD7PCT8_QUISA|nr:DUF674 family protein [Quillaja saponaria]
MASRQDQTLPLKLFIDKEKQCVVMAEARREFVDILFSFLTLPMGTIIRLVSKQQSAQQPLPGINNLYQSVNKLGTVDLRSEFCKRMLLFPRNPCETLCTKTKIVVDDTEPTKYSLCSNDHCSRNRNGGEKLVSFFLDARCSCGKLMDRDVDELENKNVNEEKNGDGVFVKGAAMFLISDDLEIMPNSLGNSVTLLVKHDYRDFNQLKEVSLNVGLKEILDILKHALISNSTLTDVFLKKAATKVECLDSHLTKLEPKVTSNDKKIDIKVIVSKSKTKILYADASEEFVDFLFSFLTIPLGSVIKLLGGNSFLGCLDNLYKSVENLMNSSWCTESGSMLLNLGVASKYSCQSQLLNIHEENPPQLYYGIVMDRNSMWGWSGKISKTDDALEETEPLTLIDPRCPPGQAVAYVGFMKKPALFVVDDDLQVTPLSSTSSISFLKKLSISLEDFEEQVVGIGEKEALNLLRASLTSNSVLSFSLADILKRVRCKPPP